MGSSAVNFQMAFYISLSKSLSPTIVYRVNQLNVYSLYILYHLNSTFGNKMYEENSNLGWVTLDRTKMIILTSFKIVGVRGVSIVSYSYR